MDGGLQLGPPGRWWDDGAFASSLGLSVEQQRKMDAIFDQNRANVLTHFQAYQDEQSKLRALTLQKVLDEPALMAEIERVGRVRTDLELANTHMLLQIRALMSAEQIARLDSHR